MPAPWTSPEIVQRARDFLVAAGQSPIVLKRELDGFIMNRMQGALLEEAFRLVANGFANTEDVDIGIREGLALRWSFMGPFRDDRSQRARRGARLCRTVSRHVFESVCANAAAGELVRAGADTN